MAVGDFQIDAQAGGRTESTQGKICFGEARLGQLGMTALNSTSPFDTLRPDNDFGGHGAIA